MSQPVILRYINGDQTLQLKAHYDAGLEGAFTASQERMAVRFVAMDPFWYSPYENAVALSTTATENVKYVVRREGGWDGWGNNGTATVRDILVASDRSIYIGGDFLNWAGDANADYIAKWDGSAWGALGTGMNNSVYDMVEDAAGNIYACGNFTTAGGGAANYIAKWNGSAWSALGSGLNGLARAMKIDDNGNLYVAGDFTTAGGSAANYIAKWDGSAWSALGSGLNGTVHTVVSNRLGYIVVGGAFTTAGGVTSYRLAYWDGSSWQVFSTGANNTVYSLEFGDKGELYVAGDFTSIEGVAANYIARWNWSRWKTLGTGTNGTVRHVTFAQVGYRRQSTLYVSGSFTQAGGLSTAARVAQWKRDGWAPLDIDLPGLPTVHSITFDSREGGKWNIYLAFDTTGVAYTSGGSATTVTNSGSAPAYPKIKIKRSGGSSYVLEMIRNDTTGDELLFDLDIMDGETVIIDLTPGSQTITSDYRGNLMGKLLPNSDFFAWELVSGNNDIYVYASSSGSPTVTANMIWRDTYWTVDDAVAS